MPNPENGIQHGCNILPFAKEDAGESTATTTTMAALLAITVVHDAGVSAEQRLIEIIEQSGDAEVLDTEDVLSELGIEASEIQVGNPVGFTGANDNAPAVVASD